MTRRRVPLFWSVVLTLAAVWLLLDRGLPWIGMWATGRDRPLPVPGVIYTIYFVLALVGAAVYVTASDESIREFFEPLEAGLRGPRPGAPNARRLRALRLVALLLVPVLAGAAVWARTAPSVQSPTILRIQHPTMPVAYEGLRSPFREATDRDAALAEGRVIFQVNCRPCHGDAADGGGPMAWGFRLKPASFTDPGTIATVVEAYAFWRVTEGGSGLPPEATPWDSAMPAWRAELTDEQRWKAVLAAYDLAGVEPRKPERLAWLGPAGAWAQSRPPESPENLERGRQIYAKRCLVCHGDKGDGEGPVAPYLNPRPRDFTLGSYKFRTTESGQPPTDEDLFRIVTNGIPGTAMSGWATLSAGERWLVIGYVKQFSAAFKETGTDVRPSRPLPSSDETLARGRDVYQKAKCWECHGQRGRGDGPSAAALKDDAGHVIRAANLRKGWLLKGGRSATDIYMRLTTGVDGTPMPSYADSLSEEERWALAHYVRSLQTSDEPGSDVVLRASRMTGRVPEDPEDPRWASTPLLTLPLAGQVITRPRWQNHAVDAVSVRALYDERDIAFLLEWDDPFPDVEHQPGPDSDLRDAGYPRIDLDAAPAKREKLRDAVGLQFPVTLPDGLARPHFFLGSSGRPVALWRWRADANAVVKARGEGPDRISELPPEAQDVRGRGVWANGRWRVVMTRPLAVKSTSHDLTFEPGRLVPFAAQAWDGSNGEKGLMMSLSSWSFLLLDAPTPATAWIPPILGAGLVGLAEWWLVRRARSRSR